MKSLKYACLSVALLTLAACGQMGAPEAPLAEEVIKPLSSVAASTLAGSETSPVSVVTDGTLSNFNVTFAIDGSQAGTATFEVNQNYVFNGTSWIGSNPVTFSVSPRNGGDPTAFRVANIKLSSLTGSGASTVQIAPFGITNSNQNGGKLAAGSSATVHVRLLAPAPAIPANTPPSLTVSADITEEATSAQGAAVNFAAGLRASDLEDGVLTNINCTPASGSVFPLSETTVNCSVTDSGGLSASGSFKVTVADTTAPVISGMPSNQTLEATGPSGAVATWTPPTANDLVDGSVAVNCDATPGDVFGLGINTVTCTASDARNNSATSSFTITVQDTTPPVITWGDSTIYGGSFYFGSVPAAPTCSASDLVSGNVTCTVTDSSSTVLGSHTLTATARDGAGNEAKETRSYTVLAWTLKGFYSPVDMNGVVNVVKAGATVPLKFEVFAASELTNTSAISSFKVVGINCLSNTTDDVEFTTTGGTSLRYDSTAGQFIQNWQTPKTTGCYSVTLTTQDGSQLNALFRLR